MDNLNVQIDSIFNFYITKQNLRKQPIGLLERIFQAKKPPQPKEKKAKVDQGKGKPTQTKQDKKVSEKETIAQIKKDNPEEL